MKYAWNFIAEVGDPVLDCLTGSISNVVGIEYANGKVRGHNAFHCVAYWIDNDYLDGGRHPWEIDAIDEIISGGKSETSPS